MRDVVLMEIPIRQEGNIWLVIYIYIYTPTGVPYVRASKYYMTVLAHVKILFLPFSSFFTVHSKTLFLDFFI